MNKQLVKKLFTGVSTLAASLVGLTAHAQPPNTPQLTTSLATSLHRDASPTLESSIVLNSAMQTWSSADYERRPQYVTNFRYSTPISVNQPRLLDMAQGIADRYQMRLVFMAPEDFRLEGPITLMGKTVEQDAELLGRALGAKSPVIVEVSGAERVLRVVPRGMGDRDIARLRNPLPNDPILALEKSSQALPQGMSAGTAMPAALTLVVRQGEPLESAVSRFVRTQGYTLHWRVESGFESKSLVTVDGSSMIDVLNQVLPPLGLKVVVDTEDKIVLVRPGHNGVQ